MLMTARRLPPLFATRGVAAMLLIRCLRDDIDAD